MDFLKVIQNLHIEKEKLERVIAALEDLQSENPYSQSSYLGGKRRGRKSMNAEERLVVSLRMKKYWASRRKRQDDPGRQARC